MIGFVFAILLSLLISNSANAGTLVYTNAMTGATYFLTGDRCVSVRRDNIVGSIPVRGMTMQCAYTSSTTPAQQPHFALLSTVDSSGGSESPLTYVVFTAQSADQPDVCFILEKYAAPHGGQAERGAFGNATASFHQTSISSTNQFYAATGVYAPQAPLVYYDTSGSPSTCSGTNCSNALVFMQIRRISCANLCSMASTLRPSCCPSSCSDNTSDVNVVGTWIDTF
ncbi:MAG: hypothetical protein QXT45_02285 [Candidatus Bilamarchaeaceae archaeon]